MECMESTKKHRDSYEFIDLSMHFKVINYGLKDDYYVTLEFLESTKINRAL